MWRWVMKTIERTNIFADLEWNTRRNTHHNEAFGYSCSFPETWKIDTSFTHNWIAQFPGGQMDIATFNHTNRVNVSQYITSILSLYGENTTQVEQSDKMIGQMKAIQLQLVIHDDDKVIYSTHYIIDICHNALLISIDIEERFMTEIKQKRL